MESIINYGCVDTLRLHLRCASEEELNQALIYAIQANNLPMVKLIHEFGHDFHIPYHILSIVAFEDQYKDITLYIFDNNLSENGMFILIVFFRYTKCGIWITYIINLFLRVLFKFLTTE